jgi:hypothetical protein
LLRWAEIRGSRQAVPCLLMIACICLPAAARRQSSDDGTAKKPSKSTPAHHVASKSSSPAAKTSTSTTAKRSSRKKHSVRARGQQKIDSGRAQEIQSALVRAHYLNGTPTGTWNQASEDAMRRYQADHGWQSKTVPDSRALISLGLGPSKDHLLNPESAMTTVPEKPHVAAPQAPRIQSTPAPSSPATVPTPAQTDPSRPQ